MSHKFLGQTTSKNINHAGQNMVKVLGHEVREGSKKHQRLLQDKKHYDDLLASENSLPK